MTSKSSGDSEGDAQLNGILAEFIQQTEAGLNPDPRDLLERHPEYSDEFQEFFSDKARFDRIAKPFIPGVDPGPQPVSEDETLISNDAPSDPMSTRNSNIGSKLRYFGDYELLEEIARGGMGVVYKARQVNLKRIVALKMILSGQLAGTDDVRRFQTEAEAAAKLNHPNIVPIFEIGQHEGQHYFSMAFVEGQSLAHELVAGPLPPRAAAQLMKKVADAITYAHIEGVVHRDLKPANVLLDKDGEPHVTDFGLAKQISTQSLAGNAQESAANLTATGQILGTPSYMSPEQASGKTDTVGPLADVYSLGALLYCLVTGRPPFQAASPIDTLMQVLEREPVPPRQLNPKIPRDLETICLKCLEKDCRRRYESAHSLSEELQRFLNGEPILARPVSRTERAWRWCRRNPAVAAASALAVAGLVATTIVSVRFALHQREIAETNRQRLAESYLDKGQFHSEQGDVARGMLWLARSLETAPASATDLQRAIRANLGAWRPRPASLQMSLAHTQRDVATVAFSGDGKVILTVSDQDRIVHLWDRASGKPIGKSFEFNGTPKAVALSPDGNTIVTGSNDHGVSAWMRVARDGTQIRPLQLHPPRVEGGMPVISSEDLGAAVRVAYSGDGTRLATADLRTVQLWNPATGEPVGGRMRGPADWIDALALSHDGRLLAAGSRDGMARIWDTASGEPLGEPLAHGDSVVALAFSPDGKTLLTGCNGSTARLWDVATGKQLGEPLSHSGWVWAVVFSPDGTSVLTGAGGGENTVRLWDVATRKLIGLPLNHDHYVNAVAFSPDGRQAISGSRDGTARVWNFPGTAAATRLLTHDRPIQNVAFSPDGRLIAVGTGGLDAATWKGSVWFWNAETGEPAGEPLPHEAQVAQLVFSPDGKLIATGIDVGWKDTEQKGSQSKAAEVRIWNVASRKLVCEPLLHWGDVPHVEFSADSQRLITVIPDGTTRDWDVSTGRQIGDPGPGERIEVPRSQSPNGRYEMLGNGEDGTGFLRDRTLGRIAGLVQPPGGVGRSAFSPDSQLVVTLGSSAWLWDVATRKPIGPPLGPASAVAFSPDGRQLLTGSWDGTARLWTMPPVVEGSAERVTLWAQVLTGAEISDPVKRILRADEWLARQKRLEQLGGPPLPP